MAASKDDAVAEGLSRLTLDDDKPPGQATVQQPTGEEVKEAPPRVRPSRVTTRDITREFLEATKDHDSSVLRTGELVRDDQFTLFESVGALEIMDPKMDSGYLAPGETLEDDYDISRTLLPEEVVGIMDQLLCLEMAWHMGNPLSQTLYTSLYLERLLALKQPKTMDDVQFLLPPQKEQQTIENPLEEDFVTHLYNRDLLSKLREQEVMDLLNVAISCAQDMEAIGKARPALIDRLSFRKSFLTALIDDHQTEQERSSQAWSECAELLPLIYKTEHIGKAVPDSFSVKIQRKLPSTVPPRPMVKISFESAFSHLKRLCQDGKDVWNVLDYHGVNDLVTFVWTFQSRKPQPSVYIRAILQSLLFEDMKILRRKSIQQVIYDDLAETVLPADLLIDPQNHEIEVVHDPRFEIAKRMNHFVLKARDTFLELFRCICQNRSRIRRTLCHSIYDWDNVQLEAEEIDNDLRTYTGEEPIIISSSDEHDHDHDGESTVSSSEQIFAYPLSSWAYLHKLRQMEWIVLLGFELDIYQPEELAGMYWHLQYLAQTRISHLERIRGFVTRKLKSIPETLTPEMKEAFTTSLSFLNFSLLEASACYYFAHGLSCLYTTLTRLSLLPSSPRHQQRPRYSNDSLRYELRLKPFLPITLPEVLPFYKFNSLVHQPGTSTTLLLHNASESVSKARKFFEQLTRLDARTSRSRLCHEEWRAKVRDGLRACIAAGVVVMEVERGVGEWDAEEDEKGKGKERRLKVVVGGGDMQGYHEWWVVPRMVKHDGG
ncbi:MAG: hypothetical protein M1816_007638 [Peltula sp. TS41687]|nr:MAG: hypothetical protein M1816_007638 [Peltula sp. TS41687]